MEGNNEEKVRQAAEATYSILIIYSCIYLLSNNSPPLTMAWGGGGVGTQFSLYNIIYRYDQAYIIK